jgi:hypothetical protein
MLSFRRSISVCLAVAALCVGTACGGDETTPQTGGTSPPGAAGGPVNATVKEWSVLLRTGDADNVKAGSITFEVFNEGPTHKHEFVVVKTDLAPNALPTKADGSVDETGAGIQVIGEVEEFDVGKTESTTLTLAAGKYVLFCNVVEEEAMADMGDNRAHYKMGMFFQDPFIVT